jgi:FKBP-type peptidyl-prolyl cis-trans isomerase SlyD
MPPAKTYKKRLLINMNIEKDCIVGFNYSITNSDGNEVETSNGEAHIYLHGREQVLPRLEKEFDGHIEGDNFTVDLACIDAYGPRNEDNIQRIAAKHLTPLKGKLKTGSLAVVQTEAGPRQVKVIKMGKFQATVDANHPHAGEDLSFAVEITLVREATSDELAHGHAHGADGHVQHN